MFNLYNCKFVLVGIDFVVIGEVGMVVCIEVMLGEGLYGLVFSFYVDGQDNMCDVLLEQIWVWMVMLVFYIDWVCIFFCMCGNEVVFVIVSEFGFKFMVGVWIDDDVECNEMELVKGIELVW